ncbi:MAG: acyltransferase [Deltaproteobacteria bacterium]|nr:MAG: acyltransferase [Deltaproteobacteria bacterium]
MPREPSARESALATRTEHAPNASALTIIRNFLAEHSPGGIASLLAEQYLGALLRPLPGFEGLALRAGFYRLLFARLEGFPFIYPGARLDHCRGIRAGRSFAVHSGAFVSGRGGLTVGNGVLIGPNAVIVSTQHRYELVDRPICEQGHRLLPTTIGDDVWVGANAVILPGTRTASGTIVSAGAVVTQDTEPYSIVAGVPARMIGRRPQASTASEAE